ncbi:MAG: hypothetical protein IV100_12510 [Myxococcales bacterium]|nr:hypothetical protein [Myxococcales bacterium]
MARLAPRVRDQLDVDGVLQLGRRCHAHHPTRLAPRRQLDEQPLSLGRAAAELVDAGAVQSRVDVFERQLKAGGELDGGARLYPLESPPRVTF